MTQRVVLTYDNESLADRDIIVGVDEITQEDMRRVIRHCTNRFGDDYRIWQTLRMHGPAVPREVVEHARARTWRGQVRGLGLENGVLRIEFGREDDGRIPEMATDLFFLYGPERQEEFSAISLYGEADRASRAAGLPGMAGANGVVMAVHTYSRPAWQAVAPTLSRWGFTPGQFRKKENYEPFTPLSRRVA